jgi:hypothetical protein
VNAPVQYRGMAFAWHRPEVERDVFPPRIHRGTVAFAGAWVIFTLVTAAKHLVF